MKVRRLGANATEITLIGGGLVLVSYDTPVAAWLPESGYYVSETKYSRTTSKHVNQWLAGNPAKTVPAQYLADL